MKDVTQQLADALREAEALLVNCVPIMSEDRLPEDARGALAKIRAAITAFEASRAAPDAGLEALREGLKRIVAGAPAEHPNGGNVWIESDLTGDDLGQYKAEEARFHMAQEIIALLGGDNKLAQEPRS